MPTLIQRSRPSFHNGYARCAAESAYPNLWTGLRGLWVPALGPTGLTLRDVSGRGNHGTLTNMAPATDWVVGEKGWALNYDAVNDFVDCGNTFSVGINDWSVTAWIRQTGTTNYGAVVAKGTYNGVGDILIYDLKTIYESAHLCFRSEDAMGANNPVPISYSSLNGTGWRYIAVTRRGQNITTYLDGNYVTTEATSAPSYDFTNAKKWTIGARDDGANQFWQGDIGTVTIHLRSLQSSEIQQLHVDPLGMLRPRRWIPVSAGAAPPAGWFPWLTSQSQVISGGVV